MEAMTIGPIPSVARVPILEAVMSCSWDRYPDCSRGAMPIGMMTPRIAKMKRANPVQISLFFKTGLVFGLSTSGKRFING